MADLSDDNNSDDLGDAVTSDEAAGEDDDELTEALRDDDPVAQDQSRSGEPTYPPPSGRYTGSATPRAD